MRNEECLVLFNGEVLEDYDVDTVKSNLAKLFKKDAARIEPFFSGKTIVLKKNIDHETAKKYERIICKAGGKCWISYDGSMEPPSDTPPAAPDLEESIPMMDSGANAPVVLAESNPEAGRNREIVLTEQLQRGKIMGQRVFGQAQDVSGHAIAALKILITDPLGGQRDSLYYFQKEKALTVGIVFNVFFIAAAFLVELANLKHLNSMMLMLGSGINISSLDYVKLILLNLVPPLSLCLSFWGINRMFGSVESSIHAYIYSAGVVLIPSGIALLIFFLVGSANFELIILVALFGITITILMINSALTDVYMINTQKTVLLTPAVLLLTMYLSKVLFLALVQRFG